MTLSARPTFGTNLSLNRPSPAQTPTLAKRERKLSDSSILIDDGYGGLITPDNVKVPMPQTIDLGNTNEEMLYRALDDDTISEIFFNDEQTMIVSTSQGRRLVEGFGFDYVDEYINFLNASLVSLATQATEPVSRNYLVEAQIRRDTPGKDRPVYARCHILTPPSVPVSPVVTIAKMPRTLINLDDMVLSGTVTRAVKTVLVEMIRKCGLNVVIAGNTGAGKELPADTPILTPCGFKPISECEPGTIVLDKDAHLTRVTGLVDNGGKTIYEIHSSHSEILQAGKEHQWLIKRKNKEMAVTTEQLEYGDIIPAPKAFPVNKDFAPRIGGFTLGLWLSTKDKILGSHIPELQDITEIPHPYLFAPEQVKRDIILGLEQGKQTKEVKRFIAQIRTSLGLGENITIHRVIKKNEKTHMYCIAVDSPSKTYLHTKDLIVTHNTTLTRALLPEVVPDDERVCVIEDLRELFVPRLNVTYLNTSPVTPEKKDGLVTMDYLVRQAMRMRVDQLIIGECRGSEAYSFIRACNTGARRSMLTIHSENARGALEALTTLSLGAEDATGEETLRKNVARAVDLVIFMKKLDDGRRVIHEVVEVGDIVSSAGEFTVSQLFYFDEAKNSHLRRDTLSPGLRKRVLAAGCTDTQRLLGITNS